MTAIFHTNGWQQDETKILYHDAYFFKCLSDTQYRDTSANEWTC